MSIQRGFHHTSRLEVAQETEEAQCAAHIGHDFQNKCAHISHEMFEELTQGSESISPGFKHWHLKDYSFQCTW